MPTESQSHGAVGSDAASRLAWAKQTMRLALCGEVPDGEAASDAFDDEYEEALRILYPEAYDDA